jgi:hypothetical protein
LTFNFITLSRNPHLKEITDPKINKKRRRAILSSPLPEPSSTPNISLQGGKQNSFRVSDDSKKEDGEMRRSGFLQRKSEENKVIGKYLFDSCDDDVEDEEDDKDEIFDGEKEDEVEEKSTERIDLSQSSDQMGEGYLMGGEEVFQVTAKFLKDRIIWIDSTCLGAKSCCF